MVYVADTSNNRIRAIGPNELIDTVAGTGIAGLSGDGGPADRAQLNYPDGLATGDGGIILVADTSNSQVRAISTNGRISTLSR